MALWAKTQQLLPDAMQKVRSVYTIYNIPMEVRHFLSQWIEENFWNKQIDTEDSQNQDHIAMLINSFIQQIETRAATFNGAGDSYYLTKLHLMEAAEDFRHKFSDDPVSLYKIIRHCLATEMNIVSENECVASTSTNSPANLIAETDSTTEINLEISLLRQRNQDIYIDLQQMASYQEGFQLRQHDCAKLNIQLQSMLPIEPQNTSELEKVREQKDTLEQQLNAELANLIKQRLSIVDKLKVSLDKIVVLQSKVLDKSLMEWKRAQQLAGNGFEMPNNLNTIQSWCESCAELLWSSRQKINQVIDLKQNLSLEPPGVQDKLPDLISLVTSLLSSLVTSTFIVEKQPPQVVKTNTRFSSTVRLLVGNKLNVHMTPPQVSVSLTSESNAVAMLNENGKSKLEKSCGDVLNNTGVMTDDKDTGQLSINFRNLQLKNIKRKDRRASEFSVMDEKFAFLFQSQFSIGELVFQMWTLSLPVVVVVHGNQEPHAWGTITWDNAFAEHGRMPFVVPNQVPWVSLAAHLNAKFQSAIGRGLTDENLQFLAAKAFHKFSKNLAPNHDYSNMQLDWSSFCKENLPDRTFTFWDWFYAIVKLSKEHLRESWCDGHVFGFVSRNQTEYLLSTRAPGTFLIRFSESELGGITIAWHEDQSVVYMLQPLTCKDLSIRSLADRICDIQKFVYLYPDLDKEHVFTKYCKTDTENNLTVHGYVKFKMVARLPERIKT